jgi:hypothetical protein
MGPGLRRDDTELLVAGTTANLNAQFSEHSCRRAETPLTFEPSAEEEMLWNAGTF